MKPYSCTGMYTGSDGGGGGGRGVLLVLLSSLCVVLRNAVWHIFVACLQQYLERVVVDAFFMRFLPFVFDCC